MTRQEKFLIIASIITCYLIQSQRADKYTDENRPYEFGFNIDGQQHRHEEKDKNGIIKGEYGFITADDVYHVTVYATDEQGRFRILSMKNIHYRDYKSLTGPSISARQGHSLQLPSSQPAITSQKSTSILKPSPKPPLELEAISIEPPANSCSHCSIPTTSTEAPNVQIPTINKLNGANSLPNAPGPLNVPNGGNSQFSQPKKASFYPQQQNYFSSQPPQAPREQSYSSKPFNSQLNIGSQQGPGIPSVPNFSKQQTDQPKLNAPQNYPTQGINGGQKAVVQGQYVNSQSPQPPREKSYSSKPFNFQQNSGSQQGPGIPSVPNFSKQQTNHPKLSVPQKYLTQGINSGQNAAAQEQYIERQDNKFSEKKNSFSGYQGPGPQIQNLERLRSGKQYTGSPILSAGGLQNSGGAPQSILSPNQKPVLAYAQMQIVDKNTDIHAKRPGEKDGLPPGLQEEDMLQLLYTFNYTLGFQAHFEKGYTNGEKRGYYYTTGRNGVRTRIDYVADDNGFRPTLSQEAFDLLSDDVPKQETEKQEKYGLKGYEFKWLYFPVEASSQ